MRFASGCRKLAFVFSLCVTLLSACGGGSDPPVPVQSAPVSASLAIRPVAQETVVWCWAASAQMVFQYYGLPNLNAAGDYQCGIVAAYFGPAYPACYYNCYLCVAGIPSMDQEQLLVNGYGRLAQSFGLQSRVLSSSLLFAPLSMQDVMAEISARRPVLAGISPNGISFPDFPEHAVVIVGYDTSATPALVVNDPFPYAAAGMINPYLYLGGVQIQPGQYAIAYESFVTYMKWGNTLYRIQ